MLTSVDPGREIPDKDPVTRFVLLVLWQAHQDGATDLILGVPHPDDTGTPFRYRVDGTWYDMSPFPSHIRPSIVAELERMAGLSDGIRKGVLDCTVGGVRMRWSVQMTVFLSQKFPIDDLASADSFGGPEARPSQFWPRSPA